MALVRAFGRSRDRGGTYKWPLWVTFGSIVLIIALLGHIWEPAALAEALAEHVALRGLQGESALRPGGHGFPFISHTF